MDVKIGDYVLRYISTISITPMRLKVTDVTDKIIKCGPWEFSKETGLEIDEDLGWTELASGSYIKKEA